MRHLFITLSLSLITFGSAQYTNPYTLNTWNNPMSSMLDTTLMNNMQMMQMTNLQFSSMLAGQAMLEAACAEAGDTNCQAATNYPSKVPQAQTTVEDLEIWQEKLNQETITFLWELENARDDPSWDDDISDLVDELTRPQSPKPEGADTELDKTLSFDTSTMIFVPAGNATMPGLLAQEFATSPEERTFFEDFLSEGTRYYEDLAHANGGEVYDVVRAFAFLAHASYIVYFDDVDGLSQEEYQALKLEIARFFSADPMWAGMSNYDKQRPYEFAASLGGAILLGSDRFSQIADAGGSATMKEMAAGVLEYLTGTTPDNLVFTPAGVVRR